MSRNNRNYVGVWLSDSEYEQMQINMATTECMSVSKHLRSCLFSHKQKFTEVVHDAELTLAIQKATSEIKRIGQNYNQAVKQINDLIRRKNRFGEPLMNEKLANISLEKLTHYTEDLINVHEMLFAATGVTLDPASGRTYIIVSGAIVNYPEKVGGSVPGGTSEDALYYFQLEIVRELGTGYLEVYDCYTTEQELVKMLNPGAIVAVFGEFRILSLNGQVSPRIMVDNYLMPK